MLQLFHAPLNTHLAKARLLAKFKRFVPNLENIAIEILFFIAPKNTLSQKAFSILKSLLSAQQESMISTLFHKKIFILPKDHRYSDWALEVSSILPFYGLSNVEKIERVQVIYFKAKSPLHSKTLAQLASQIYDPSLECFFSDFLEMEEYLKKTFRKRPATVKEKNENPEKSIALFSPSVLEQIKPIYHKDSPMDLNIREANLQEKYSIKVDSVGMFSGFYFPNLTFQEPYLEMLIASSKNLARFFNQLDIPQINGFLRTLEIEKSQTSLKKKLTYNPPLILTGLLCPKHSEITTKPVIESSFQDAEQFTFNTPNQYKKIETQKETIEEILINLLRLPCIADKSFLITLQDSSATGRVVQSPMIGPWQTAIADCGILLSDKNDNRGIAIAIGERPLSGLINPAASARMALAESISNLAGCAIEQLADISLLGAWIGSSDFSDETEALFQSVAAISKDICEKLKLKIDFTTKKQIDSPLTVMITAHAKLIDAKKRLTPYLKSEKNSILVLIEENTAIPKLGGSCFAQITNQIGLETPDILDSKVILQFFNCLQDLQKANKLLAYHDRSDGGLMITVCEMAFGGHLGVQCDISDFKADPICVLFHEGFGGVIQIRKTDLELIEKICAKYFLLSAKVIGEIDFSDRISVIQQESVLFTQTRIHLQQQWSKMSFQLQSLRDNPRTAKLEYERILDKEDPGIVEAFEFNLKSFSNNLIQCHVGRKPVIGILLEQGITGVKPLEDAFELVGFKLKKIHMNALISGEESLLQCDALVAGGGFSFGDVLGAGQAWAKRILFSTKLTDIFSNFFQDRKKLILGIGNGCQMLANLKPLIPGATLWPYFIENFSQQFEARVCLVEIQESPSILFQGMQGSKLLVPVSHRFGQIQFEQACQDEKLVKQNLISLCYVDGWGRKTKGYPANPSGSVFGICGFCTQEGRINLMMPHPERMIFNTEQTPYGPWLKLFINARQWFMTYNIKSPL